jgi:hypothetical protein
LERNGYSQLWTIVEPTLPPHLRQYARNFSLLQKSKEEAQIDTGLPQSNDNLESMDYSNIVADIDDDERENLDQEIDLASHFETENLIEACHHVAIEWHEEQHTMAQRLPLHTDLCPSYEIQENHLTALNMSHLTNYEASGLQFRSDDIVKQWETELKKKKKKKHRC